jgi:hypothetical protein
MSKHFAALGLLAGMSHAGLAFGQAAAASESAPAAGTMPQGATSAEAPSSGEPAPSSESAAPASEASATPGDAQAEAPVAANPEKLAVADTTPPPAAPLPPGPTETQARTQAAAPSKLSPLKGEEPEADAVRRELEPGPWRGGHAFALEGLVAVSGRFGSFNAEFENEEHLDTAFLLGGYFALSSSWAVGLELEHAGLGRGASTSGLNSVSVEYDVTSLWLGGRVFPYRSERAEVSLGLRVGAGWQSLDANGIRERLPTTSSPETFSCSATGGPAVSLGAYLGAAYRLSTNLSLVARADGVARRLSGDVIGNCAPGAGSITGLNVGGGLFYSFDLGKDASLARQAEDRVVF